MGFELYRQGAFTKRLADLPDQPNMQAAELKTYFDSSPEELRQALNRLCDALGEFSAAAKLGYTASAGVPAQTVQDAIENVQKQVRDASVGKPAERLCGRRQAGAGRAQPPDHDRARRRVRNQRAHRGGHRPAE